MEKESTNPKPIEELLDDDTFMEVALQEFYNDALLLTSLILETQSQRKKMRQNPYWKVQQAYYW